MNRSKTPEQQQLNSDREVIVSLEFFRIGEIDIINERFFAELILNINWTEANCALDAYDIKKYWNPKIFIENLFDLKFLNSNI